MPPLRILQVIEFFTPRMGGSVQAAYQTARHMAGRGHQVTLCSSDFGEADPAFPDTPFEVLRFHSLLSRWGFYLTPGLVPWAWGHLREFDLVHLHNLRTFQNLVIGNLALRFGVPYVISPHGSFPKLDARQTAKQVFDALFGNRLMRGARTLIAVSQFEARQFAAAGFPADKINLIYNGLDLDDFFSLPERGSFRQKLNVPTQAKIVLFLGRIHRLKSVDFLIEAFACLSKEVGGAYLVIAGPDDGDRRRLETLVAAKNIGHRVRFTGPLFDQGKLAAYVDADVLVSPGAYEMFGLVSLESLLCGTPIVVTQGTALAEMVAHAGAARLVTFGDVESLSMAIASTLEHPEEAQKMVRSGQQFIRRRLQWKTISTEIEALYFAQLDPDAHRRISKPVLS
jgi:glycosyltransferase involved in cell wall biosynthesis